MKDFFRGWRRKFGCVTLMLACLSTAGWVSALQDIQDIAVFPTSQHTTEGLVSCEGSISWVRDYDEDVIPTTELKRMNFSKPPSWRDGAFLDPRIEWDFLWCGFGTGRIGGPPDRNWLKVCWAIPYWSVVIPLTALAAYLLISTPRPSSLKKIIESTANDEGAAT